MVNIRKWEDQILNTRPNHNALTKGHCIVQVNFIGVGDQQKIRNRELKVWSQEYTINAFLAREKGQEEVYDKLRKRIKENGFKGRVGFFMAVVRLNIAGEKMIQIEINPERMLPTESWAV